MCVEYIYIEATIPIPLNQIKNAQFQCETCFYSLFLLVVFLLDILYPKISYNFVQKEQVTGFDFLFLFFFFGVSTGKTSFCSITLAVVQHRQIARKFYVIISYSRDRTITDYNRIGVGEDIMRERENKCNFSQSKEIIEKKNREDGPAAL